MNNVADYRRPIVKTQWRKMESWRPAFTYYPTNRPWCIVRNGDAMLTKRSDWKNVRCKTEAAALRAANAANRRDGLPEVT